MHLQMQQHIRDKTFASPTSMKVMNGLEECYVHHCLSPAEMVRRQYWLLQAWKIVATPQAIENLHACISIIDLLSPTKEARLASRWIVEP